jgi:hypothetical protein
VEAEAIFPLGGFNDLTQKSPGFWKYSKIKSKEVTHYGHSYAGHACFRVLSRKKPPGKIGNAPHEFPQGKKDGLGAYDSSPCKFYGDGHVVAL